MIFGLFDKIVIFLFALCNVVFLKKSNFNRSIGCVVSLFIFGVVLPAASIFLELERVTNGWKEGEIHDNYELLYVYLKFPIYWAMGVIQAVVAIRFLGKKEN